MPRKPTKLALRRQTGPRRLNPPAGLSEAEQAVWRSTVGPLPRDWFTSDQAPLLVLFCRHVMRSQRLAALLASAVPDDDLERYQVLCRMANAESAKVLTFARALRLTPHSRMRAGVAANAVANAVQAPTNDPAERHLS